jgi:type II secretory pathway pseudopilin PulG
MRAQRFARGARVGGFTLVELLFCLALSAAVMAVSLPLAAGALDAVRTAMAARYLQACISDARMEALRRSATVALRFEPQDEDYVFGVFVDGNANGVRTADVRTGADPPLAPDERLRDRFPGVFFGLIPGVPEADGSPSAGADGVRLGSSRILSLTPDGTATSGTLYVRGRRAQHAVRVLGATGRTRALRYDAGAREWVLR